MNPNQRQSDYPTESSRLTYYFGCNTPISGMLWDRHIKTLRILEAQATALAEQLRYELGGKP
jgi:hypothetical protein